jgi:hypothetical protein
MAMKIEMVTKDSIDFKSLFYFISTILDYCFAIIPTLPLMCAGLD